MEFKDLKRLTGLDLTGALEGGCCGPNRPPEGGELGMVIGDTASCRDCGVSTVGVLAFFFPTFVGLAGGR